MPKKCCIANCRFQSDDPEGSDLSYYKIPADPSTKELWIKSIRRHFDVEFNKWSYVCSLHFEKNCISITEKRAWVKKGYIRTLFAPTRQKYENVEGYQSLLDVVDEHRSGVDHESRSNLTNDEEMNISVKNGDNGTSNTCDELNNEHDITDMPLHNESSTSLSPLNGNHVRGNAQNDKQYVNFTNHLLNVSEGINQHNESSMNSSPTMKRSITKIDVDALLNNSDVCNRPECLTQCMKFHNALKLGQAEVIALRKKLRSNRMKTYRAKKKVNNVKTLMSHMKKRIFISEQVSEILEVSSSND